MSNESILSLIRHVEKVMDDKVTENIQRAIDHSDELKEECNNVAIPQSITK